VWPDLVVLRRSQGVPASTRPQASPHDARALRQDLHCQNRLYHARSLDRQLARLHKHKNDLLRVLDRPEIPLHTNGSENDIRTVVTKRKISGGTVSENGKVARDTMLGLLKTCSKLGVSFYQFLGDRFAVAGAPAVPALPHLLRFAKA